MTSSTPVRPLYPFSDSNPPPGKRQRVEGKQVDEELSDDELENQSIYVPAGGSGDECSETVETRFEDPDLFADEEPAEKDHQDGEANFECTPCSGGRVPRTLSSPVEPSAEAIEQHYTNGHLPYRNWCNICVRSKGV